MFENIAAIDIGTSSVKLICVKTGLKDFNIKTFAYQNIDPDIENPLDAVNDAIQRLTAEVNIKGYMFITSLPMEKSIIRNIVFPFNDVAKIAEAIPYEAEENIPFKLDDLIIDFQSLKSSNPDKGRILLAAAHKDTIYDFINPLSENGIKPAFMGMESNGIFECYRYFNKIPDESIIQLDIGNNKTVINIISGNNLLYSRSIFIGINLIHKAIAEILDVTYSEAIKIYEGLNLDLTSVDNNIQRGFYKQLNITKPKFNKIYDEAIEIIKELIEQIYLTVKSFGADYSTIEFNRILLSGGGSGLMGIGFMITKGMDIPAEPLPFLDDYNEQQIKTQFPTALGMVLSYLNNKRGNINFLKGEFTPDVGGNSKKIYYLAIGFVSVSIVIFLLNLLLTFIIVSRVNDKNNQMLNEKYKRYFGKEAGDDPLAAAQKMFAKEKKELDTITGIIQENSSLMDLFHDMLSHFNDVEGFDLKNLIINENIIRFDGSCFDSRGIDNFKEKLLETKKFDSVTLNIRSTTKNQVFFTMTIKQKVEGVAKPSKQAEIND